MNRYKKVLILKLATLLLVPSFRRNSDKAIESICKIPTLLLWVAEFLIHSVEAIKLFFVLCGLRSQITNLKSVELALAHYLHLTLYRLSI
jgi:hypothetical protein